MKLKIGTKLGLGFGVILVLMIASGVLSYMRLTVIKEKSATITEMRIPTMEAARIIQDRLDYTGSKARHTILAGTEPARREKAQQSFDEGWAVIDKQLSTLESYASHWTLERNRQRYRELKENLPKLRQAQQATMDEAAAGGRDSIVKAGNDYADKVTPKIDETTKSLDEMVESFDEYIQKNKEELDTANNSTVWTLALSTLLALAVGITVSIYLSRKISGSAGAVLHQAEAIAAGDLTAEEAKVTTEDELGDLTRAITKCKGA